MNKLFLLGIVALAAAGGGAAWYFSAGNSPAAPPIPDVPADWTDPPMREWVGAKRRAVVADPKSAAAWGELGMAFEAHERFDEAVACYRAAATLAPDDGRWTFLIGRQFRESDPREAVRLYRASLDQRLPSLEHRAAVELTLAEALAKLGDAADAEAIFARVYRTDPANPWAALRHAQALVEKGADGPAVRALEPLGPSPHARKRAAALLAAVHRRAGRQAKADEFEFVAATFPDDQPWNNPFANEVAAHQRGPNVMMDTFTYHEAQRNYPAALQTARRMADLYPSPRNEMILGRALVNVGDYEAAVPPLEDAVRGDPNLTMAHAFLGVAWYQRAEAAAARGRADQAKEFYLKAETHLGTAVAMKVDYAPGFYYLARLQMKLNRPDAATDAIRKCIQARPEEWEGYVVLGEILAAQGKKDEAVRATEQAVKLAPRHDDRPRKALEKLRR